MRDQSSLWPLKKLLVAPIERVVSDTPVWGWIVAWFGGIWQGLTGDAFSTLLVLIVATAALDYYYGVKAARFAERFSPTVAQRGWHGKMSGIALLLAVRLFEGWAASFGFVDTKGGLATALGIALFTVDLQSIAHHRESFEAAPIPVLGTILAWMRNLAAVRLPPPVARPVRSARSGNWSEPGTWANGVVPRAGDRVVIAHDVMVQLPAEHERRDGGDSSPAAPAPPTT